MRPGIFEMACLVALLGACGSPPARSAEDQRASTPPTPAPPPPPVGDRVILDAGVDPAIAHFCVGTRPEETSYVVPTSAQVAEADAELDRGLTELDLSIADYNRQYTGVICKGRHLICVNGLSAANDWYANTWRRIPFYVIDGGWGAFRGAYDPVAHAFTDFGFSAMASPSAADRAFIKACGHDLKRDTDVCDPVTPASSSDWRDAAERYLRAVDGKRILDPCTRTLAGQCLDAGWSGRYAPRPAFRAAFAYKQLGDYPSAVTTYERFVAGYGDDELLAALEHRDAEQVEQLRERVRFLQVAYDSLYEAHLASFDFAAAGDAYERGARNPRLAKNARRRMLKEAMTLFRALGDRARLTNASTLVKDLEPTPAEKAAFDESAK